MKDSEKKSSTSDQDDIVNLNDILFVLAKLAVILSLLILSIRFPLIWVKIPLVTGVLYLGWHWIFRAKKKKNIPSLSSRPSGKTTRANISSNQRSLIELYEAAAGRSPKPDQNTVQLLVAYDAAGEFGRAKALIQRLDGAEFPEVIVDEFAVLARNYFPIELEPTENGVRFKLA